MGKIVANLTREQIEAIGDALDLIGTPWSVASSGESHLEDLFAGEGGVDDIKGALVWLAHAQKDMSKAIECRAGPSLAPLSTLPLSMLL